MGIRLSIIIPTSGRITLENTVASVLHQLAPEDELIVVGARAPQQFPHPQGRFIHRDNGGVLANQLSVRTGRELGHPSGAEERDLGDAAATGTHLLHIDDDDIFTKTAFADIRAAIRRHPRHVLIAQMKYGMKDQWVSPYSVDIDGEPTLGVYEAVELGNFGGMCMVFPRVKPNPPWADGKNSAEDFFVTKRYLEALGTDPIWPHITIGIVRPSVKNLQDNDACVITPVYAPQVFWNGRHESRLIPGAAAPRQTAEEWSYEMLNGKDHPSWTARMHEFLARVEKLKGNL